MGLSVLLVLLIVYLSEVCMLLFCFCVVCCPCFRNTFFYQMLPSRAARASAMPSLPSDVRYFFRSLCFCCFASCCFFRQGWERFRSFTGGCRMPRGHRQIAGEYRRLLYLSYKVRVVCACFLVFCLSYAFGAIQRLKFFLAYAYATMASVSCFLSRCASSCIFAFTSNSS